MPTIYRVICEHCTGKPETGESALGIEPGCAGHVVYDGGGDEGVVTQGWYWAVLDSNNQLVPLQHPAETSILASQGMTYLTAGIRGRLVHVRQFVCEDCGVLYEVARLRFFSPLATCLTVLGVGPAAVWLFQTRGASHAAIIVAALMALVALHPIVGTWVVRQAYRARAAGLTRGPCPSCGSQQRMAVDSAEGKKLLCPRCGNRAVSITVAGIS